jgi:hypothetical protein
MLSAMYSHSFARQSTRARRRKYNCGCDAMKTPPKGPEFARFTEAMRGIMKVSKAELQRRMEADKRTPKPSSPDSVSSPKRAT